MKIGHGIRPSDKYARERCCRRGGESIRHALTLGIAQNRPDSSRPHSLERWVIIRWATTRAPPVPRGRGHIPPGRARVLDRLDGSPLVYRSVMSGWRASVCAHSHARSSSSDRGCTSATTPSCCASIAGDPFDRSAGRTSRGSGPSKSGRSPGRRLPVPSVPEMRGVLGGTSHRRRSRCRRAEVPHARSRRSIDRGDNGNFDVEESGKEALPVCVDAVPLRRRHLANPTRVDRRDEGITRAGQDDDPVLGLLPTA